MPRKTSSRATATATKTENQETASPVDDVEAGPVIGKKDDGAHMDNFVVPELDDGTIDEDAPLSIEDHEQRKAAASAEVINLIDKEGFWQVFKTSFSVPGILSKDLMPLAIQGDDEPPARAASDAVYGLLQIYYPAALNPEAETIAHLFAALPFFAMKVMVVREIVRARRQPPAAPAPAPAAPAPAPAANDNKPAVMDQEITVTRDVTANWNVGAAA